MNNTNKLINESIIADHNDHKRREALGLSSNVKRNHHNYISNDELFAGGKVTLICAVLIIIGTLFYKYT